MRKTKPKTNGWDFPASIGKKVWKGKTANQSAKPIRIRMVPRKTSALAMGADSIPATIHPLRRIKGRAIVCVTR